MIARDLQLTTSSLLSLVFWLVPCAALFLSPAASPLALSVVSTPMPKSTGRRPARFGMLGSAPTSSSWWMMLRIPMRAAMLRAVSPLLSCALTISLMNRTMFILAGGLTPLLLTFWLLWLLPLPCRTTHSSRHSR